MSKVQQQKVRTFKVTTNIASIALKIFFLLLKAQSSSAGMDFN